MSRTSRALALVAFAITTGCVEPTQYGGPIRFERAGMEARVDAMCALGHMTSKCAPPPEEGESPHAEDR